MGLPSPADSDPVDAEIGRYDWSALKSFHGDASALPAAVKALVAAEEDEPAKRAYWRIDNVALIQGRLSECAAPVVSCLVAGLPQARGSGRAEILDLLATISGGYDDHVDVERVGPVSVADCVHRMIPALPLFVDELWRTGNASCVDLLLMCGIYAEGCRARVREILEAALRLGSCGGVKDLIEASLADLG